MKTCEEACAAVLDGGDYLDKNKDLLEQLFSDSGILRATLSIRDLPDPEGIKIMKALSIGVMIGMEMEK